MLTYLETADYSIKEEMVICNYSTSNVKYYFMSGMGAIGKALESSNNAEYSLNTPDIYQNILFHRKSPDQTIHVLFYLFIFS